MRVIAIAIAMAGVLIPANPAAAQFARATPPPIGNPMGLNDLERARQQSYRNEPNSVIARQRAEAERIQMDRAERLATLVNEGKCGEAHQIALAERDVRMANRIAQVCRGEE